MSFSLAWGRLRSLQYPHHGASFQSPWLVPTWFCEIVIWAINYVASSTSPPPIVHIPRVISNSNFLRVQEPRISRGELLLQNPHNNYLLCVLWFHIHVHYIPAMLPSYKITSPIIHNHYIIVSPFISSHMPLVMKIKFGDCNHQFITNTQIPNQTMKRLARSAHFPNQSTFTPFIRKGTGLYVARNHVFVDNRSYARVQDSEKAKAAAHFFANLGRYRVTYPARFDRSFITHKWHQHDYESGRNNQASVGEGSRREAY